MIAVIDILQRYVLPAAAGIAIFLLVALPGARLVERFTGFAAMRWLWLFMMALASTFAALAMYSVMAGIETFGALRGHRPATDTPAAPAPAERQAEP